AIPHLKVSSGFFSRRGSRAEVAAQKAIAGEELSVETQSGWLLTVHANGSGSLDYRQGSGLPPAATPAGESLRIPEGTIDFAAAKQHLLKAKSKGEVKDQAVFTVSLEKNGKQVNFFRTTDAQGVLPLFEKAAGKPEALP